MATYIVGGILVLILIWAFKRVRQSVKSNTCPGCSGGCASKGMCKS